MPLRPALFAVLINGVAARGDISGGIGDRGGPVISDGMLYLNSGYARMPGPPGNVLLTFSVDRK
jgi:hypothetical protein